MNRPTLRLLNGAEMDALSAYYRWEYLQRIRRCDPRAYSALISCACDQEEPTDDATARLLVQSEYADLFKRNGNLQPEYAVLLRIAQENSGRDISHPFELRDQSDHRTFDLVQHQAQSIASLLCRPQ